MSLAAAKYITKYTHKGPDRATLELRQRNEVSDFKDSRYIAASEAAWRIFEFPIHHQEPAVISLQVHLPGQHMVLFNTNESPQVVSSRVEREQTMLTGYFRLNQLNHSARCFTFQEIPLHFVWDPKKKEWRKRQRGGTIGRMIYVSPTAGERFYLRTLLTVVKGSKSWEDLKSFNGKLYDSFHAACLARGLLENDDEWRQCLQEASLTHVGRQLRQLFSLILRHCNPAQPDILWKDFKTDICDDLLRHLQQLRQCEDPIPIEDVHDYGLFLLDNDLQKHGSSLRSYPSMPRVRLHWQTEVGNPFIAQQLAYDVKEESYSAHLSLPQLNTEQREAFNLIWESIRLQSGKTFFLDGAGGTGKTFVYSSLCHSTRAEKWIALCVASCAIAALLLPSGHTAHSTFAIPVQSLTEDSCCQIDKNGPHAEMLRRVRLIVWDEAVTQHR